MAKRKRPPPHPLPKRKAHRAPDLACGQIRGAVVYCTAFAVLNATRPKNDRLLFDGAAGEQQTAKFFEGFGELFFKKVPQRFKAIAHYLILYIGATVFVFITSLEDGPWAIRNVIFETLNSS